MSSDNGLVVEKNKKKWLVKAINLSTMAGYTVSEHKTRLEAIDSAAKELEEGVYEYGIVHISQLTKKGAE